MTYYDDILNVNAYLRQKMKNNLIQSQALQQNYIRLDHEIKHLTAQVDDAFARVYALAAEAGMDVSGFAAECDKKIVPETQMTKLLIHLPADFNFESEFERLRKEAHAAGFTDVHPEELLSAEEMERARAFDASLNARFAADTGLADKDIHVMLLAVAVRIVVCAAVNYVSAAGMGTFASNAFLNSEDILSGPVPFDVSDNKLFKREDVVGFDKYLGFVLGVINFMTNTVTTFDFKSYAAGHGGWLFQRISTPDQVLRPIFENADRLQSQILTAVIREACVLDMVHMDPAMAVETVKRAIRLEKSQLSIGLQTGLITKTIRLKGSKIQSTVAAATFINTLVTGIHALLYDPENDGDLDLYAVRTNKILMYSNAMAMTINSMPAFFSGDLLQADWGGVLTMCFSIFHSMRFWIDTKTDFLVSAYKKEIDKQMLALEPYFVMEQD